MGVESKIRELLEGKLQDDTVAVLDEVAGNQQPTSSAMLIVHLIKKRVMLHLLHKVTQIQILKCKTLAVQATQKVD